ncbi:hypothetical protein R1sor_003378 [Riccia sorocarpa]|uniref:Ubiquitin-like-conjugating enzyme ATG10 n=1 Tax=Riccia sorocarpa TaxID=122646 RepID=A0ABD3H330_9MARC
MAASSEVVGARFQGLRAVVAQRLFAVSLSRDSIVSTPSAQLSFEKMHGGTLSGEEFQCSAKELLKVWNNHSSSTYQWYWQECSYSSAGGYLILEDAVINFLDGQVDEEEEDSVEEEDNSPDAETLTDDTRPPSRCTYHVIYNESYRVPSMYFRGYHPDGRPINWLEVGMCLSSEFARRVQENKWTFLTQEEHPFLHRPWYMLHPCGTSSMMAVIFSQRRKQIGKDDQEDENDHPTDKVPSYIETDCCKPSNANSSGRIPGNPANPYLLTWLSFVGPVLRLPVHLDLFKSLD